MSTGRKESSTGKYTYILIHNLQFTYFNLSSLVKDLVDGDHDIIAGDYPAFLYELNGANYKTGKVVDGLLQGSYLLRVSCLFNRSPYC